MHTHMHVCTHVHTHTRTRAHMHAHTHTHTHTKVYSNLQFHFLMVVGWVKKHTPTIIKKVDIAGQAINSVINLTGS